MYKRVEVEKKNNYPFIYVHGFTGWGEDDKLEKSFSYFGMWSGKAKDFGNEVGFECYQPSLGPYNSAWDRACELWAHIVGGRVDYGKVHSEKYGHERYGRTYKAIVPDWGKLDKEGKIKKINLIGHSFGGPTTRMFIDLVVRGSEEEKNGTPENELSELFKGGHTNWIHSETTLAATHNGVTLPDAIGKTGYKALTTVLCYAGAALCKTRLRNYYDFKLDQFGISEGVNGKLDFKTIRKGVKNYANSKDTISYGMSVAGATEITKDFTTFDNIYYFSYAGCRTTDKNGKQVPLEETCPAFKFTSKLEGKYTNSDPAKGRIIDSEWFPNDSLVNVVSARAPFNERQEEFVASEKCVPGIWYKMPIEEKDHVSYMGYGEKKEIYSAFYFDIMKRACNLPSVD